MIISPLLSNGIIPFSVEEEQERARFICTMKMCCFLKTISLPPRKKKFRRRKRNFALNKFSYTSGEGGEGGIYGMKMWERDVLAREDASNCFDSGFLYSVKFLKRQSSDTFRVYISPLSSFSLPAL